MKTRERLKGILRNFSLSLFLVWGKSQSKETRDFQRGTHVMAISLTISLDYSLFPELELSISVLLF